MSTIGIVYGTVVGLLIYRRFDWKRLMPMLTETACLSGAILLIIGTATGMAWGLTQSGFSRSLATAMTGLPGGAGTFIAVSIVAFVVLGSVLEGIPAIVLFGPLLFPIARAVGVHEVHYAMIIILAMGVGLFAPPFGVGYYAACAIGRVDPAQGIRPIWGYMLALLVGLLQGLVQLAPDAGNAVPALGLPLLLLDVGGVQLGLLLLDLMLQLLQLVAPLLQVPAFSWSALSDRARRRPACIRTSTSSWPTARPTPRERLPGWSSKSKGTSAGRCTISCGTTAVRPTTSK